MSVDVQKMNRQMEKIKEREERNKKEKVALLNKRKSAKTYALQKLGEIFLQNFKVDKGEDHALAKSSLIASVRGSFLQDNEKIIVEDLIKNDILNF